MKFKTCNREDCEHSGNPQPISNFHKRAAGKDGYRNECKSCRNKASKAWSEANKEHIAKNARAWNEANKERKKETDKAWYEANKEYCKKYSKAWYEENKGRKKETDRARYEAKRIAEGKELGVRTPPTNLYIGFLEEVHGKYFKVGITSCDSMTERFKKDRLSEFVSCEELAFIECSSEEEARSMEREFISLCTKELGSPVLRKERFDATDKNKCISIAKKATPL